VGPNEIHPWVLRELADPASKPLSIIFERQWQSGEVPTDQKKGKDNPYIQEGKEKIQRTTGWPV